ncbi:hypothetical protein PR003_g33056 [Phytophthora rubi]|uniref:Uncharacterized protein n=1 Tax=Phytophthora rubi TaxID=129364 RepID=A0A6A4ATM3_9STRA|nr:hypothetical protein PR003_g33056 [Phytophthora rubi]
MIAEFVDEGAVEMKYVSTADNVADIFTKALGPQRFEYLRDRLNLEDVVSVWSNVHERMDYDLMIETAGGDSCGTVSFGVHGMEVDLLSGR